MDRDQLSKAFTATVQASLHGLRSLLPVLEAEQQALVGKDPDRLEHIVQEKLGLLKQLEHSVQARDRLQRAAGVPVGIEGGDRLVEAFAIPELGTEWSALVAHARQVAELNDRNGRLVFQGQRNARDALGILTGRSASDDTYRTLRRKGGAAVASYTLGRV